MRISPDALREMLRCLFTDGANHRRVALDEINRFFLNEAIDFFTSVAEAKLRGEDLADGDWYEGEMLDSMRPKEEIAAAAGLAIKTISNIRESTRKEVVVDESLRNYRTLRRTLDELIAARDAPSLVLTIKIGPVGVDLTIEESLIVVNALATRHEAIRGGAWSSIGKALEVPLMESLCLMFGADRRCWRRAEEEESHHQIDFVLQSHGKPYLCEVKLMGKGNPESAKAAYAHNASLLVGDRISEQAKTYLAKNRIEWVAMAEPSGWKRFGAVLGEFNIDNEGARGLADLDEVLDEVLAEYG